MCQVENELFPYASLLYHYQAKIIPIITLHKYLHETPKNAWTKELDEFKKMEVWKIQWWKNYDKIQANIAIAKPQKFNM